MNYTAAVRHLKKSGPVMRGLIARVGPCRLDKEATPGQFAALVDAIIYQQLAYKAAQTISSRFQQLYASNGRGRLPRPEELLRTPTRKLRAVGLSRQKMGYLRDLAGKVQQGALLLAHGQHGANGPRRHRRSRTCPRRNHTA